MSTSTTTLTLADIDADNIARVIEHYPYRTALVPGAELSVDRDDIPFGLEHRLYQLYNAGLAEGVTQQKPDNHVVFHVRMKDGSALYFWFSNSVLYVDPSKFRERRW